MALVAQPLYGVVASQVANAATVGVADQTSLQTAIDSAASGDVISIDANFTLTQSVYIAYKTLTINGNGHTLSAGFLAGDTSHNAAINFVNSPNVTINNLSLAGTTGNNLWGINAFKGTVTLNGVSISGFNQDAGMLVNSATVNATNISTANNNGNNRGIYVKQNPSSSAAQSKLNIYNTSHHTETAGIYIEDITKNVQVNDIDSQYAIAAVGNQRFYSLPVPEFVSLGASYRKDTYKGINVDIRTNHLTDAVAVEVKVDRSTGGPVIKTAKQPVIDAFNAGTSVSRSAPIVIQSGTYDEIGSTSWNMPTAIWTAGTLPTSVTVTITRANGDTLVKTVPLGEVAGPHATRTEVMPANQAPVGSVTSPASGDTAGTANGKLVVKGLVNDDLGQMNYVYAQLVKPGVSGGLVQGYHHMVYQNPGAWAIELNTAGLSLTDGTYGLNIKYVDMQGNMSQERVDFVVDNTFPTFAINNPVNGSYVRGTVNLKAEIKDENDISKVLMNIGGISRSWEGTSATITRTGDIFATNVDTTTLPDGAVYTTLRGTDSVGNVRYWNNNAANRQHVFTVDNTAPQFSNISITPRINSNTGGSSVTVYFDITDAAGVDLDKTYVMFADGPNTANQLKESVKVKPVLISGNSYKATFDSFQFVKANYVGNYNLQFTSEDVLGNRSSSKPSAFRNILVDNSGPSSTWTAPNNGDVISGTTRFSFDVSDHTGVLSGYVKLNGPTTKSYNLVHDTGSIWYADVPTTELIGGSYTVDARFVDVFNRPRYGANKGMVIIDNTAPTISSIIYNASPSGTQVFTDGYTNEKNFVFHLVSGDGTTRYQLKYWNYIAGSGFNGESHAWSPADISATGHMATLGEYTDLFTQEEGVHYFSFSACDAAGNCSSYSDPFVVTYDNTAPVVTVNSIDDIQLPTNTQTITGTVADANTVKGVEVSTDGGATWQDATTVDGTNWTYDATGLSVETYTVVARATDEAGNVSSDDTSAVASYWTQFTVSAPAVAPDPDTSDTTGAGDDEIARGTSAPLAVQNPTITNLNAGDDGNATTDTTPATDEATDTDVLAATTTDSNKDGDTDGQVLAAEDTKGNWSVVNLVLAVVTIILSLGALLGLARKKDGTAARIMTLIPVAIAVTAFLMIENWTASMIWLNWWTVLYAVVLAVQVAIVSGLKNSAE